MTDYFLIARINSAFGKTGFVKVQSFSDFPERFFQLKTVFIDFFGSKKEFTIEEVKQQKSSYLFKFKNFDNDADVSVLTGKEIYIDSKNAVKLPKGMYFIHDLIGSSVYQTDKYLGEIKDVLSFPANDVYVVESEDGEEILLPAVMVFIEEFNAEKKILTLKPDVDIRPDES